MKVLAEDDEQESINIESIGKGDTQLNQISTIKRDSETNQEDQIKLNDIELNKSQDSGPLSNGFAISSQ